MSRKDYQLIADALLNSKRLTDYRNEATGESEKAGIDRAANAIAVALRADNPRFDRDRFLKAAGVR